MNRDDDGVGYIADSHLLRPSPLRQQEMALLKVPRTGSRSISVSSSVSDLEDPIYDSENLSTARRDIDFAFNLRLIFAITAAALSSAFQHGYNTGVVNSPQQIIKDWITDVAVNRTGEEPTKSEVTMIWSIAVSIFCAGGMVGGALTGVIADRFGRKGGLLFNNVFVVIASIAEGAAKAAGSYEMIIFGRFVIGINSGLNAGLVPMYLAEISPLNLRGSVGSVYQLVITISILLSQILSLESILGSESQWPVLLAITVVPAIFQLITLPLCPESPKFLLLSRGQELEAQRALSWLRGSIEVHEEMEEMRAEYESMKLIPKVTLRELITNNALRIPLIIALVVMIGQQLSGINAVFFYSTEIFKMASLTETKAQYATLGMGVINVLMTVISLVLVEKCGRRSLLLVGFIGMCIDSVFLTFALQYAGGDQMWVSYLAIIFVLIFVIMFATGPGSIPWFLVAELFSQSARPAATSLAVAINWTANFLVGLGFLPLQEVIGSYVFIIFAIIQALVVVFIWKKVPETKNKTMEEISSMFRQQSYQ